MLNLSIFLIGLPGGWEWVIVVLLVIIFFGAKKIPELARGVGKGIREFKDATKDVEREITKEGKEIDNSINRDKKD